MFCAVIGRERNRFPAEFRSLFDGKDGEKKAMRRFAMAMRFAMAVAVAVVGHAEGAAHGTFPRQTPVHG